MAQHQGNSAEFLLKFLVVGNAGVGKTCILHQYVHSDFKNDSQHTIGAELGSRLVTLNAPDEAHPERSGPERRIKLQIWDTAGQERFRSVTRSYYRGACGALLVYDITDRQSFSSVSGWLADAQTLASQHIVIILCGNKSDLASERQVTTEEAESFAKENNMYFFETSAKDGLNVDDAFYKCTEEVIGKIDNNVIDLNESGTGILRYGGSPVKQASSGNSRGNGNLKDELMTQVDAKIDLLRRETDEAMNKLNNCC